MNIKTEITSIKITAILFFVCGVFAIYSTPVFAYEKIKTNATPQNDFAVEPGKTEVYLNPGETITKTISITNRVEKTVKFRLSTEDLKGTDDPNTPIVFLGDDIGPYSLKNLVTPEITEFSLDFGEKITIPVKISIPADAEPRGYYGAVIVSNAPDKEISENKTSKETEGKTVIVSRIGSIFLVRINGEGKEEGYLSDFKIKGPFRPFYEKMPAGFEIGFKNNGNVHLVPYGMITIRNMFGASIKQIPVDAYFALPNSTRYREVISSENFGFGRYKAHLSLYKGYGDTEIQEQKDIYFWVLPWKILTAVFLGLVILISFIYYIATRFEIKKKQ